MTTRKKMPSQLNSHLTQKPPIVGVTSKSSLANKQFQNEWRHSWHCFSWPGTCHVCWQVYDLCKYRPHGNTRCKRALFTGCLWLKNIDCKNTAFTLNTSVTPLNFTSHSICAPLDAQLSFKLSSSTGRKYWNLSVLLGTITEPGGGTKKYLTWWQKLLFTHNYQKTLFLSPKSIEFIVMS